MSSRRASYSHVTGTGTMIAGASIIPRDRRDPRHRKLPLCIHRRIKKEGMYLVHSDESLCNSEFTTQRTNIFLNKIRSSKNLRGTSKIHPKARSIFWMPLTMRFSDTWLVLSNVLKRPKTEENKCEMLEGLHSVIWTLALFGLWLCDWQTDWYIDFRCSTGQYTLYLRGTRRMSYDSFRDKPTVCNRSLPYSVSRTRRRVPAGLSRARMLASRIDP